MSKVRVTVVGQVKSKFAEPFFEGVYDLDAKVGGVVFGIGGLDSDRYEFIVELLVLKGSPVPVGVALGGFMIVEGVGGFGLVVRKLAFFEVVVAGVLVLLESFEVVALALHGDSGGSLFGLAPDLSPVIVHGKRLIIYI